VETRLSMWTDMYADLEPEEALERLLDSSFPVFEFGCTHLAKWVNSGRNPARLERIAHKVTSAGRRFHQLHAPIMNGLPPEELLPHMLTAIDAAAILGARWVVVHPVTLPEWAGRDALDEECVRTNQRYFTELVDAATARGVGNCCGEYV